MASAKALVRTEALTRKIANEYRDRARLLPQNGQQDIGARRELRMELQARCNLSELEAVNIINGYCIREYVEAAGKREGKENEGTMKCG